MTRWLRLLLILVLIAPVAAQLAGCASERTPAPVDGAPPDLNERFLAEDLDVDRYIDIFEAESREIYAQREGIAAALGLEPGMAVADVGAGTGLFMPAFTSRIGAAGTLYAVEIAPRFLDHLRRRARDAGHAQVQVVRATEHSVELPAASIDVAFVCDTYHHFSDPASTLASLRAALRPGASLVIVDFERVPGETPDWVLEHVRAGKDVFIAEIEAAGFELVEELEIDGLEQNYVLRFRRP